MAELLVDAEVNGVTTYVTRRGQQWTAKVHVRIGTCPGVLAYEAAFASAAEASDFTKNKADSLLCGRVPDGCAKGAGKKAKPVEQKAETLAEKAETFADKWVPVWIMKAQLGAAAYDVQETAPFRSGRARARVRFFTKAHCLVAEREGMHMTSKAGRDYWVVGANEWADAAPANVGDVYE